MASMPSFHKPTVITTVVIVAVLLVGYHLLSKRSSKGD